MTTAGLGSSVGPTPDRVVVVGNESALGMATYLDQDHEVLLLSDDPAAVRTATAKGVEAQRTAIDDGGRLREPTGDVAGAVVSTDRDRLTLLVAQLLRTVCGVDDVVVVVNDTQHIELFEEIDVRAVHEGSLVGPAVDETLSEAER